MASPDNSSYKKLLDKLRELFELDKADLDFGIYRIIGQRQDQIDDFLSNQLKNSVAEVLSGAASSQQAELEAALGKAEQSARDAGFEPEQAPKVKELRKKLASLGSSHRVEHEVYEHLYRFFSRYYEEGDFISQRRVSRNARYAIPYNGEEVKLHWANSDQYYIKSSENFRDYRFKLTDGRGVHFKLQDADTNRDNTKGDKRFFRLADDTPVVDNGDDLLINFHYSTLDKKKITDADGKEKTPNQSVFNGLSLQALAEQLPNTWLEALSALQATKANPKRTLLEKHLNDYTAKNSFDYFIHKDLGGFLRQELDFYIKNEVMFLDDIEDAEAPKVESYLRSLKAIRRVAAKVIDFLAQLENFQKKLWLKKKFVVQCDYCITLDRVPEQLYIEIVANDAQIAEWRKWGFVEADTDLDVAYLLAHPYLLIDTKYYRTNFRLTLLGSIENIDAQCDGLLIHADNFQALNLLQNRYREKVRCIYIDPPYNTGSSSIPYKNSYKHSSWGTMMFDRLRLLRETMSEDAAIYMSIDKLERTLLEHASDLVFDRDNRIEELIWSMNTNNGQAPNYSTNHEYVLVYSKNRAVAERDRTMFREPKPGYDEVMILVNKLNSDYPPVVEIERQLKSLYKSHIKQYREQVEELELDWDIEKRNDLWKGLYNYSRAEYRSDSGALLSESEARELSGTICVWREDNVAMPATKQAVSTQDKDSDNWRFYRPLHPVTNQPCPHPKSGWKFRYGYDSSKQSFQALDDDNRIAWGENEIKVPQIKRFLHEVETNVGKSVFTDYSDGEKQTSAMFGSSGVFLAPKHANFVARFVQHATKPDSVFVDCFGGSGSSAHAVITANRADKGNRKYILVEQGAYFDTVLKPRIQKVVYSENWKSGKPIAKDNNIANQYNGISHCFKYLKLESYEDTLNNLELRHSGKQQELLAQHADVEEDYLLNYMLDVEAKGSLLKVDAFKQPFEYQLHIATDSAGETRKQTVDLVETFNYLLGLRVHTQRQDTVHVNCKQDEHGVWQRDPSSSKASGKTQAGEPDSYTFLSIDGTLPDGKSALVVWRILNDFDEPVSKTCHNIALDYFLIDRKRVNPREGELDVIYVNGDNTLPNIRAEEEHWKVRLIEEEFQRLMFAGEL